MIMRDLRTRSRISLSMLIMAILMMSADVPWIGMFTAIRSEAARAIWFPVVISGRRRRRPEIVST